ncbi:hypothetical protein DIPPA_05110 [Diplonema papillatum]|nr:hypothetical protein DIPPA_05110 [Diplonema papillatum]
MEQLHIMLDQANIRDGVGRRTAKTSWRLAEWQAPLPDLNDAAARGEMEDGSSTEEVSVVTEVAIAGAASRVSSWNGTTAEKGVVFGSPPAVASHAGRRRQMANTYSYGNMQRTLRRGLKVPEIDE